MTVEKKLERELIKKVKKLNGLCLKFQSPNNRGVSDRIVLMPCGRLFFVELKDLNKKLDPLQEVMAKRLLKIGHKTYLVNSKESLNNFIKMIEGDIDEFCTS